MQRSNFRFSLLEVKILTIYLVVVIYNVFVFSNIFTSLKSGIAVSSLSFSLSILLLLFSIFFVRGVSLYYYRRKMLPLRSKNLFVANDRLVKMEAGWSGTVRTLAGILLPPFRLVYGYTSMVLEGTLGRVGGEGEATVRQANDSSKKVGTFIEKLFIEQELEEGLLIEPSVTLVEPQPYRAILLHYKVLTFLFLSLLTLIFLFALLLSTLTISHIFLEAVGVVVIILCSFFIVKEMRYESGIHAASRSMENDSKELEQRSLHVNTQRSFAVSWISNEMPLVLTEIDDQLKSLNSDTRQELSEAMTNVIQIASEANQQLRDTIPTVQSELLTAK